MASASLQSVESTTDLPVEMLYNRAVTDFIATHAELSKMPQDGNNKLASVDTMLRDMGVERDNDMSFLIMGAMGKIGMDAISSTMGVAASPAVGMGLDIAGGMAAQMYVDSAEKKTTFKRAGNDQKSTSVFKAPAPRKADATPTAPKRSPGFATSILKASAGRGTASKTDANKRKQLQMQMAKSRSEIELLDVFKKSGYKYARRLNKMDKNGQIVSLLVPVEGTPTVALAPKTNKRVDLNGYKPVGMGGPSMAA